MKMKRITASSKNIFVKDKLESILMLFMINYVWLKKMEKNVISRLQNYLRNKYNAKKGA
jgi:hypothetical protein